MNIENALTSIRKDGFVDGASFSGPGDDDFLSPTQLSDYGSLVDDYDVSELECEHIQAAARYGW